MKFLIYVGHPAQYLFFKNIIISLLEKNHKVVLLLKTKDVLESLVKSDGFQYINVLPHVRGNSKFSIIYNLIKRNLRILPIIIKEKPDLLIGGDPSISQLGWLLRKNRITLTEDDYPIIKKLADITFPFAQAIICPNVCDAGKWSYKKIGYDGYMKLSYLHPKVFQLNDKILEKYKIIDKYALIRLAKLTAHHDFGIRGINESLLDEIIFTIEKKNIKVYISSEYELKERYHKYILNIQPSDIHQLLGFSEILISDSQSMSVEAAILGVPSIRYSDFAGKISVLEELEHKYLLTFGFPINQHKQLISKLNNLIEDANLKKVFTERQIEMLEDKINVSAFFTWFILNWPNSFNIMKENPEYQFNFK